MSLNNDNVYRNKLENISPFEFNTQVANVFEDMLQRSIPFYNEIHKIILDLSHYYIQNGDLIYDLGSSTGDTIILLHQYLTTLKRTEVNYIGIDNSKAMIKKCQQKFKELGLTNIELLENNLQDVQLKKSKMIIMNYTLQFIKPDLRNKMLKKIHLSLKENGVFILSEKINAQDSQFNPLITKLYYDFKKRNGYSELEISQKREALENVMIPTSPDLQKTKLLESGFSHVEIIFRWYNFATYLCLK